MKSYSNNPHTVYNGMASSQRNMFVTATLATALIKFSDTFDDKLVKFNIKIISLIIFMMSIYYAISSSYDFLYYLNKNENLPDNIPKNNWYKLRYINYIFGLLIFYIAYNYFIQITNIEIKN